MLIFSFLCLLKATTKEPFDLKDVKSISGNIYSVTRPPHQIAAFADGAPNALLYANRLKDKKCTSVITEIKDVIDCRFYVEKAHQTEGGWIVYHSDNASQTGRKFESYVESAAASWETLKTTISSTLANFMRDYKVAFLPVSQQTSQMTESPSKEESQNTIVDYIKSVQDSTIHSKKDLESRMKQVEDSWLKENKKTSPEQYVLPVRPSNTDGLSGLPRIVSLGAGKQPNEQEKIFYNIISESKVYQFCPNGVWGGNNCMFAAINHHPEVIKEIVTIFGKKEKLDPEDSQFKSESIAGGKTLRRIVCQWILDHMDDVVFQAISHQGRETGGMPSLTVKEIISSIGICMEHFDPVDYISKLRDSTDYIDEDLLIIISAQIKRPIVVVTKVKDRIVEPRMGASILSRIKNGNPPIYLFNDSREGSSGLYGGKEVSGGHYSGLRLIS